MASPPSPKRQKAAGTGPVIGTHSGTFHADEALAVWLLRQLPAYASAALVRTRDPAQLAACHTVVDVGAAYDPAARRFDHHQREFAHTFPARPTKLSSAGLVWLHFGRAVVAARAPLPEASADNELVWRKLYADFVEAVDANDNGEPAFGPDELRPGAQPRFQQRGFTVAAVVSDMNYDADEPGGEDARFERASDFMGGVLARKLHDAAHSWLPAKAAVDAAYAARHAVHPSGRVVKLAAGGVPWKEHLYGVEEAALAALAHDDAAADQALAASEAPENLPGREVAAYYVLYPESDEPASKWRVQCVPLSRDSFQSRRPLREEWRGVRDDELSARSGIDGCVFCHASGFIGGNTTFEGALQMAVASLEGDKGFVFPK